MSGYDTFVVAMTSDTITIASNPMDSRRFWRICSPRAVMVMTAVGIVVGTYASSLAGPLDPLEKRNPTGGARISTRECQSLADPTKTIQCTKNEECDNGSCPSAKVDLMVNLLTFDGAAGWNEPFSDDDATGLSTYFEAINKTIADVTEGQVELRQISLVINNGAPDAIVQLRAGWCGFDGDPEPPTGAALECITSSTCLGGKTCQTDSRGEADTGGWGITGQIRLGVGCMENRFCFAHEFIHLFGNARDEYESPEPGSCGFLGTSQVSAACVTGGHPQCLMELNVSFPTLTSAELCLDADADTMPVLLLHDTNGDTEQSMCNTMGCWDQVVSEWPTLISKPPGDPESNHKQPGTVELLPVTPFTRVVAVIDRSFSMGSLDGKDGHSRMSNAVDAAKDFVTLLDGTTEFGLVSFSSDPDGAGPESAATTDFTLQAIGMARQNASMKVEDLRTRAAGDTQIGAGLRKALEMLKDASGNVSPGSWIFLLTDGKNNQPPSPSDPQAPQRDLEDALTSLASKGVKVVVSCIGNGRDGDQCSHIADRTGGLLIDSKSSINITDAFIEAVSELENNDIAYIELNTPIEQTIPRLPQSSLLSATTNLSATSASDPIKVLIEPGVSQARFIVSWTRPESDLELELFGPDGIQIPMTAREVGTKVEFYRIDMPAPGIWTLRVQGMEVPKPETFSIHVLVDHKELNFSAGLARSTITWPGSFLVSAHVSRVFGIQGCDVHATVERPDGSSEAIELHDDGMNEDGNAHDGLYAFPYRNLLPDNPAAYTPIYTFIVTVRCEQGIAQVNQAGEFDIGEIPLSPLVPTFERAVRVSGYASGVPDNLPPIAEICRNVRVECQGQVTAVMLDGTCSFDPEGSELSYSWSSPTGTFLANDVSRPVAYFSPGRHSVALDVTDADGITSAPYFGPDFGMVVVIDSAPPVIRDLIATPSELWAPNHTMVPVTVTPDVTDVCGQASTCEITSVESNEASNGRGDGNTEPDWEITGTLSLNLRSERSGTGDDRIYTVHVTCSSGAGNESSATVTITVPHDQGA